MTVRTDPKPSAPLDADAPSSHLVDLIPLLDVRRPHGRHPRGFGGAETTGDIGNWTEPIGLASLFVEGVVLATSVYGYRLASTRPHLRAATG